MGGVAEFVEVVLILENIKMRITISNLRHGRWERRCGLNIFFLTILRRRNKKPEARESAAADAKRAFDHFGLKRAVGGSLAPSYADVETAEASALIGHRIARGEIRAGDESGIPPLEIGIANKRSGQTGIDKGFAQQTLDSGVEFADDLFLFCGGERRRSVAQTLAQFARVGVAGQHDGRYGCPRCGFGEVTSYRTIIVRLAAEECGWSFSFFINEFAAFEGSDDAFEFWGFALSADRHKDAADGTDGVTSVLAAPFFRRQGDEN